MEDEKLTAKILMGKFPDIKPNIESEKTCDNCNGNLWQVRLTAWGIRLFCGNCGAEDFIDS